MFRSAEERELVAQAAEEFPAGFAHCWTVRKVADGWEDEELTEETQWEETAGSRP